MTPQAKIEQVVVQIGEDFPLDWQDKVLELAPQWDGHGAHQTGVILTILRRP